MKEFNLYQQRSTSIVFGIIYALIFLFLLSITVLFISGTYNGLKSIKDFIFYLFFYGLFLIPTIMFMLVSINSFTAKRIVCTLNKRQLIINEFTNRYGGTSNRILNIKDIKEITLSKSIFKELSLKIELKNNKIYPVISLNTSLSNKDKLKLQHEIEKIINN